MKLSIAWIFDHIEGDWKEQVIPRLIELFNQKTAEIERFTRITVNLEALTLAQVVATSGTTVTLHSPEWNESVTLPFRNDANEGSWFLVKRVKEGHAWALPADLGSEKECEIPALHVDELLQAGDWKRGFETEDYIIEVDNKSITNRPDMWGHRGFAREIAALLDLKLKPQDSFLASVPVSELGDAKEGSAAHCKIVMHPTEGVKRFAAIAVPQIQYTPSLLWMAHRLLRVDSKPIDAIVDITNYAMLDTSQPMHAFDAGCIPSHTLEPRFARQDELLMLLDGDEVKLSDKDIVVTDGKEPLALAGVMGGASTAVSKATNSIILESACFAATTIRHTAARHKKRTESSSRFEKSLDPNQNVIAIRRSIQLLKDAQISFTCDDEILSFGSMAQELKISVSHDFIEKRIGISLGADQVIKILTNLEFGVALGEGDLYEITVPTFRSTKDVTMKEDIVEEIGRFIGYGTIPHVLPNKQSTPSDLTPVYRVRKIKSLLAHVGSMRELCSYALYDESFIDLMRWDSKQLLEVQFPVSENMRRPVNSLVPHLLKAVHDNAQEHHRLRFFEWGRVWNLDTEIHEYKKLSGIIYEQKEPVDFYAGKALLSELFDMLGMEVVWKKVDNPEEPWFAPYRTADIMLGEQSIGRAGIANFGLLHPLLDRGDAFIFELDGDALLAYQKPISLYVPTSKYPEVERDISMMVPKQATVEEVTNIIVQADKSIVAVQLVDFFEKEEWVTQKSLTLRFILHDERKTLTKAEVDAVYDRVIVALTQLGAEIR